MKLMPIVVGSLILTQFFCFPAEARTPKEALQVLLESSVVVRSRAFVSGKGWAARWYRDRFGTGLDHSSYAGEIARLSEREADTVLSRIMEANQGNQVLFELNAQRVAGAHGGNYSDRLVWQQFFGFDGQAQQVSFAAMTPRQAVMNTRPSSGFNYDQLFRAGSVRRQWRTTTDDWELVARFGEEDVVIPSALVGARDNTLTAFATSSSFRPLEEGLAVVGNRFLVGLENVPQVLFMNRGHHISIFRQPPKVHRGRTLVRHETRLKPGTDDGEILAFSDANALNREVFGIVKTGEEFELVVWDPSYLAARGVKDVPPNARVTLTREHFGGEGRVITGVRLSQEMEQSGVRLVAVDYIGANGGQNVAFFNLRNLEPATPHQF